MQILDEMVTGRHHSVHILDLHPYVDIDTILTYIAYMIAVFERCIGGEDEDSFTSAGNTALGSRYL